MKILTILILGLIATSCSAQQKIAFLANNTTIKARLETYAIKKESQKVTIENSKNKFANSNPSSPNLPFNMTLTPYYLKLDVKELTKICAANISLKELESLARTKYAGISIDIRVTTEGKILEVSFFTDGNSILSVGQFESIENEIKTSKLITLRPEAERYIKGSNFLLADAVIYFDDMLKVKKIL